MYPICLFLGSDFREHAASETMRRAATAGQSPASRVPPARRTPHTAGGAPAALMLPCNRSRPSGREYVAPLASAEPRRRCPCFGVKPRRRNGDHHVDEYINRWPGTSPWESGSLEHVSSHLVRGIDGGGGLGGVAAGDGAVQPGSSGGRYFIYRPLGSGGGMWRPNWAMAPLWPTKNNKAVILQAAAATVDMISLGRPA